MVWVDGSARRKLGASLAPSATESSSCYTTMAAARPFIVCCSLIFIGCIGSQAQGHAHNPRSEKSDNFSIVYKWNSVKYELPSRIRVDKLERSGRYIRQNIYISDIKIYNDTLYLAMPKLKSGVLVTLGYVPLYWNDDTTIHKNELIYPFPNYRLHTEQNCDGFKSVTSFEIDPEGIMWVVDNGEANIRSHQSKAAVNCLPSLKLIDLNDDFSYTNYDFPKDVVGSDYYLKDIVVDDYDGGYAYITDNSKISPGIIVFSRRQRRSWKFRDDLTMMADQPQSLLNTLDLSDNINGIALGSHFEDEDELTDRYVFYSSLGSYNFYAVRASWLRDESSVNKQFESKFVGSRHDFSDGMIADEFGYIYYGALLNRTIYRWNSNKNYSEGVEVVAFDKLTFYWIDRFAFDERNNLYALITRFGDFATETTDHRKYNFKIIRIDVKARSYFYNGSIDEMEEDVDNGVVGKSGWFLNYIFAIVLFAYCVLYENVV